MSRSWKPYQVLGETFYEGRSATGMTILAVPKKNFSKRYALLSTNYGSIDMDFTAGNDGRCRVPAGIAHFLEHKMFEKEDGDVSDKLASIGASTNAMTSFNSTGYLVETTAEFEPALATLIDFVVRPHFTQELVDKEKGIIAEEIRMYDDDPSWRGFMELLRNMYRATPVQVDIAGSVESIQEITAEHLHLCHRAFYQPANLILAMVGDIDPIACFDLAESAAEAAYGDQKPVKVRRHLPKEPATVRRRRSRAPMKLARSKMFLGFKGETGKLTGKELLELECALDVYMGATIGRGTPFHRRLYEEGLIDQSYSMSVYIEPQFGFAMVSADTHDPAALEKEIMKALRAAARDGVAGAEIRRRRRAEYGNFVRSLDSISTLAWNLIECHAKGHPFRGYGKLVTGLSNARIVDLATGFLSPRRAAAFFLDVG